MKLSNALKILMLVFLVSVQIQAQTIISGVILDSLTHQPIPDLSIIYLQNGKGTITNENGEFEISVSSLPTNILFSHVSYKKVVKSVINKDLGEIFLSLATINLPEIKTGNPALTLLNAAINKALSDTINKYPCRAFYQKISKEGNNPTTIHEIFFEGLWNQFGITKWNPINARYANKDNSSFKFQNFTTSVFFNSGTISKNIYKPTSSRSDKNSFDLGIIKFLNAGSDDEIAEISCKSKNKEKDYFEGTIYIKTKTDNILKIVGEMYYPEDPKQKKIKKPFDSFLINFRENKDGFSILDNLTFSKIVTLSGIVDRKIVESAKLVIYEYDNTIESKNMENAFVKKDLDLIKKTTYNANFWGNNDIIKRSNLEKSLIRSFENSKGFESNFIDEK
jgi:hypothetical protein